MARKNTTPAVKITADSTPDELTAGIGAGAPLSAITAGVEALTRLDSALAVRTFDSTLAVKRAVGRLLALAVTNARTAGADASKVGADGTAVTFAHVGAVIERTGANWEWAGRKRATLSDDLNAWHDCTPARVRTFRTLSDDARTLGARKLSGLNAQHCIQWCHADANPARTTNRASGESSDLNARVTITRDDRLAAATALVTAAATGGDAVTAPIVVKVNGASITTPAWCTPAAVAAASDAELSAVLVMVEGERKRRAAARDGKAITAPTAPAAPVLSAVPAPATSAVVTAIAAPPTASEVLAMIRAGVDPATIAVSTARG